jgi:hypothetical protein
MARTIREYLSFHACLPPIDITVVLSSTKIPICLITVGISNSNTPHQALPSHSTSNSISGVSSPPPTPSTSLHGHLSGSGPTGARLNTNASAFVPRPNTGVTIKEEEERVRQEEEKERIRKEAEEQEARLKKEE